MSAIDVLRELVACKDLKEEIKQPQAASSPTEPPKSHLRKWREVIEGSSPTSQPASPASRPAPEPEKKV
jgi:hypothetical protein